MKKWPQVFIAVCSAGILSVLYWNWLQAEDILSLPCFLASLLALLLFYACFQGIVAKLFSFFRTEKIVVQTRNTERKQAWMQILFWMAVSRIGIYAISFLFSGISGRWQDSFLSTFQSIWTGSTDANSYLGIAEQWYVTEGDARFHIVFFPFYPIIIKIFQLVFQNYFVSALIVSNLCAFGAALFLYELAALDMPSQKALRTVKYFFLLPAAVFFAAPMTESLFLLLSVACIYFIRKGRYLPACLLGGLASFTRSPGVLLLVIIFIEYVKDLMEQRKDKPKFWKMLFGRGICMAIVPLGLLGYLLINYLVTGNPFQFLYIKICIGIKDLAFSLIPLPYKWDNWYPT